MTEKRYELGPFCIYNAPRVACKEDCLLKSVADKIIGEVMEGEDIGQEDLILQMLHSRRTTAQFYEGVRDQLDPIYGQVCKYNRVKEFRRRRAMAINMAL